jgi:hypothetical protein
MKPVWYTELQRTPLEGLSSAITVIHSFQNLFNREFVSWVLTSKTTRCHNPEVR